MGSTTLHISLPALSPTWIGILVVIELLWLWSVITVVRHKTPDPSDRIVWLIIILAFNFLGTLAYTFLAPQNVIAPEPYRTPFHSTNRQTPRRTTPPQAATHPTTPRQTQQSIPTAAREQNTPTLAKQPTKSTESDQPPA